VFGCHHSHVRNAPIIDDLVAGQDDAGDERLVDDDHRVRVDLAHEQVVTRAFEVQFQQVYL